MVHSLISAFILLGIGTFAAISILVIEHLYMKYLQKHHASGSATGWLALLSQVPNKPSFTLTKMSLHIRLPLVLLSRV